jgi:hypothetical protein
MGGYGANAYLNSAEVYDPANNTWSPIAAMHSVRYDLAAAAGPDGLIYAIGGYDGVGNIAGVEAYDPQTDIWTSVPPMNYAHAIRAAATGVDGRIYVFGGEVAYPPPRSCGGLRAGCPRGARHRSREREYPVPAETGAGPPHDKAYAAALRPV